MLGKNHTLESIKKLRAWRPTIEQAKKRNEGTRLSCLRRFGKSVEKTCPLCKGKFLVRPNDVNVRKYCSYTCLGKSKRKKMTCIDCGTKVTRSDVSRCRQCFYKHNSGSNSYQWRGGITKERLKIWRSEAYQKWRKSVFERDNYTCQWCKERGHKIEADHIRPFALFPKLRFELSNGRTLCVGCHKKTASYLKNNRQSFQLDLL